MCFYLTSFLFREGAVFYTGLVVGSFVLFFLLKRILFLSRKYLLKRIEKYAGKKLLKKSQQLNLSDNNKEDFQKEFIGNVSHELKTPLFTIQGYLLTLIEGGIDDEAIKYKYLNRINKSVDRLIYIVKDLDLISDLELGKTKLNYKPFNVVALVQEVFDLLEIKAEHNNVILAMDEEYILPIYVIGDIQRIEQVLINLIANAINYAGSEKKVTVSFLSLPDKKLRITVSDNGAGISPEDMPRIFEKFYRADKSRNRKQGGSGLGLAIVKHIVEAHGEKVHISSSLGIGTNVFFELKFL